VVVCLWVDKEVVTLDVAVREPCAIDRVQAGKQLRSDPHDPRRDQRTLLTSRADTGPQGELRAIAQVKRIEHLGDVRLHGPVADLQLVGDRLVVEADREPAHHGTLPARDLLPAAKFAKHRERRSPNVRRGLCKGVALVIVSIAAGVLTIAGT
jgi:hypothetical protein